MSKNYSNLIQDLKISLKHKEQLFDNLRENYDKKCNDLKELKLKHKKHLKEFDENVENVNFCDDYRTRDKEKLENQLNNERKKTEILAKKVQRLEYENEELVNKLSEEKKLNRNNDHVISLLKTENNGLKELKTTFESKLLSLEKQRNYFEKCSQMSKRKLLANEYMVSVHKKMNKTIAQELIETNVKNSDLNFEQMITEVNDLINKGLKRFKRQDKKSISDVFHQNDVAIEEKRESTENMKKRQYEYNVLCPECNHVLNNETEWRKHMTSKHFIRFNN